MFWMFFIVLLILLLVIATWSIGRRSERNEFPYKKLPTLFSAAERSFLGVLHQAASDNYYILGKVRVADVVSVQSVSDRRAWLRAFNKISAKHFDFVICDKTNLSVVAVIELNDKSHQNEKRKTRDSFLEKVCGAVSLPLIQVPAQFAYSVADVRAQLERAIPQHDSPLEPAMIASEQSTGLSESEPDANPAPQCPRCAAPMRLRRATTGSNVGQSFWGCSTFPRCKGVIRISE